MAELPKGAQAFRWAAIAEKFRALPPEIAGLTDAQIDAVLFHKRDKDGQLVPPDMPKVAPTKESRLGTIQQLEAMGLITPQRAKELRDEVNGDG